MKNIPISPVLDGFPAILTVIILVAVFGVIVLAVILIKRKVKFFHTDEEKKSDREIAEEELNRILQPIEDEETSKQVSEYGAKSEESEEKEGE